MAETVTESFAAGVNGVATTLEIGSGGFSPRVEFTTPGVGAPSEAAHAVASVTFDSGPSYLVGQGFLANVSVVCDPGWSGPDCATPDFSNVFSEQIDPTNRSFFGMSARVSKTLFKTFAKQATKNFQTDLETIHPAP